MRAIVWSWVGLLFAALPSLGAELTYTPLIFAGDPAPGIPGSAAAWFAAPGITADGSKILLIGGLAEVGAMPSVVWFGEPTGLSPVVNISATPDRTIASLSFGGNGQMAVYLGHSGVWIVEPQSLWAGPPQSLTEVPLYTFDQPRAFAINAAGEVAHTKSVTYFSDTYGYREVVTEIHMGPPPDPAMVASVGMVAPGTGQNFREFNSLVLSNAGVLFRARLNPGVPNAAPDSLWVGTPDALTLIAQKGSQAVGLSSGTQYNSFARESSMNDAGRIAFHGGLAGPDVTAANDAALWAGTPGSLQVVARKGDGAPQTPAGVTLSAFRSPQVAGNGTILFKATLGGAGIMADTNDDALFSYAQSQLRLIARGGDAAPGTDSQFITICSPVLNANGEMAFAASLTGEAPSSVEHNYGIWFSDAQGHVSLIARTGDVIDVGGASCTIQSLHFPGSDFDLPIPPLPGPGDGFSGQRAFTSLSDTGKLVFGASFTDGTQAVLMVSVPEPAALLTCSALSPLLLRRRRR